MSRAGDVPTVAVVGGSGYTGREALTLLAGHPGVRVVLATARSEAGRPSPYPGLEYRDADVSELGGVDLAFVCLPHGAAVPWVEGALERGIRVVDLTSDHRLGSGREDRAVYGLTEWAESELPGARLVANPGCYPSGGLLALRPLVEAELLDESRPVVLHAASGVTGAGRSPRAELLFAEVYGDFKAYGLGNVHRHLKEMRAFLPSLQLLFVPHLLPVPRGILSTLAVPVRAGVDARRIREVWEARYPASGGVRVSLEAPQLSWVTHTDLTYLSAFDNEGITAPTVTVVTALDNLGKGAAGQAIQNMNHMLGLRAGEGLRWPIR